MASQRGGPGMRGFFYLESVAVWRVTAQAALRARTRTHLTGGANAVCTGKAAEPLRRGLRS